MINMKVCDILAAPSVDTHFWQISHIIERVAAELGQELDIMEEVAIAPFRVEIKGKRNYDCERGAILYVMYHEDEVISIGSFAGRGLDNTRQVYVYDPELVLKLIDMVKTPDPDIVADKFDPDGQVGVVYWEGSPIVLGESIYGIDDY